MYYREKKLKYQIKNKLIWNWNTAFSRRKINQLKFINSKASTSWNAKIFLSLELIVSATKLKPFYVYEPSWIFYFKKIIKIIQFLNNEGSKYVL